MSTTDEASGIIREHVIWSMAAGLVPVPVVDIAAVSAVQLDMLSKLATTHGVRFSMLDAKSLVTALVGGAAARLGANLLKLVPGAGSVVGGLSMAILSGASTYAVGQVALNEFASGRDLSSVDLGSAKVLYEQAFEQGKRYAKDLDAERKSAGAPAETDGVEQLERLAGLVEKGLLTEEEFAAQKARILQRM